MGFDNCRDAATGTEISTHMRPDRIAGFHNIFQDAIRDVLLKDPKIAVAEEIFFVRLQFQAAFARHVPKCDHTEVWQTRLWADGGEFRVVNYNFIDRKLILPRLDGRKGEIEAGLGMFVCVASRGVCHIFLLYEIATPPQEA